MPVSRSIDPIQVQKIQSLEFDIAFSHKTQNYQSYSHPTTHYQEHVPPEHPLPPVSDTLSLPIDQDIPLPLVRDPSSSKVIKPLAERKKKQKSKTSHKTKKSVSNPTKFGPVVENLNKFTSKTTRVQCKESIQMYSMYVNQALTNGDLIDMSVKRTFQSQQTVISLWKPEALTKLPLLPVVCM